MQHFLLALGVSGGVAGLALMVRYGITFHSRLEFGGALPLPAAFSAEALRQHGNDLKGRFGFLLVSAGMLQTFAACFA